MLNIMYTRAILGLELKVGAYVDSDPWSWTSTRLGTYKDSDSEAENLDSNSDP